MKSTMKKLFSLMLVAIMLVSAVPFQAAAATKVKVQVYLNEEWVKETYFTMEGETQVLNEELAKTLVKEDKTFDRWEGAKGLATGKTIKASGVTEGYELKLYVTSGNSGTTEDGTQDNTQDNNQDNTQGGEVTPTAATVTVKTYLDGNPVRDRSFEIAAGGSQELNEALALSLVDDDKEFVKWTGSDNNNATGVTITAEKVNQIPGYYVNLYVKTKGTSSTEETDIIVKIVDPDGNAIANQFEVTPANEKSAVVSDILTSRWMKNWKNSYEFVSAKTENDPTMSLSDSAYVGETLTITLKEKEEVKENDKDYVVDNDFDLIVGNGDNRVLLTLDMNYEGSVDRYVKVTDPNTKMGTVMEAINKAGLIPARENYTFAGWYWDDDFDYKVKDNEYLTASRYDEIRIYAKWTRKSSAPDVLLKVYMNGKTSSDNRVIDISGYADGDGQIDIYEVKNVLNARYSYNGYDGLFTEDGWNKGAYVTSDEQNSIRVSDTEDTYIYVMIWNASRSSSNTTSSSSGTADTSNPKTGDEIFMAITVLGLSATALAAVYFFNKKRAVK